MTRVALVKRCYVLGIDLGGMTVKLGLFAVEGKLFSRVHGCCGEFGHMKVEPAETMVCGCGKKGCLEQYTSATGVVRKARELLLGSGEPSALRQFEQVSAKHVFDCAKAGDKLALEVLDSFADYLGRGLAGVSCVCDPQIFVIGGGVSAAGQIILDMASKAFRDYAFPAAEETRFAFATLGNDAGICGAARLVLEM